MYETKKSYTLSGNKTITGNSNYGNTVFTSLDTINVASGTLTITNGTKFVVGEISGVFNDSVSEVGILQVTNGYKISGQDDLLVTDDHTGNVSLTGDLTITGNSVITGNSTLNGSSIVNGNSTINGECTVSGDATFVGNITANEVSATDIVSPSDERLKENITPINDPLSLINDINGVTFNWKGTSKPSAGLIAQEVEKILPELVSENDRGKAVNYNGIIGLLVECVKQQQVEIENLKNSISNPE